MSAAGRPPAGWDAVVVGSGPNGLGAALTLARAGRRVLVVEGSSIPGGGARSAPLTLPGFIHDPCSAIHPFGAVSPLFNSAGLADHGLTWARFEVSVAHPLGGERAAVVLADIEATAEGLGRDAAVYRRLIGPLVRHWDRLVDVALGPPLRPPRAPLAAAGLGARAVSPATLLARTAFRTEEARALFAGNAAHSITPLQRPFTSAVAVGLLTAGHVGGWPAVVGGSGRITDALVSALRAAGGELVCDRPVAAMSDVPPARAVLFDVAPAALASIAGGALPDRFAARLRRFRHGAGVFKVDYALSGPMPWRAPAARRAGTVHVGGSMEEIAWAEAEVAAGRHPSRPFVLVAQQSLADPSRAPTGSHTLWAYCHVPPGSTVDMTAAIEGQIERFAPGWRDLVLARHTSNCAQLEADNPNYVGGDIAGGALDGLQLLARPRLSARPYRTPNPALFLCSASTPPGAGVHGMCGYHAARAALGTVLR